MKKLILPIFLVLLFITYPASVMAQFPSNCWDIMQDNTCLRNFTECNIGCPSTGDQRQRVCQDACNKTSKACSDEQVGNYKACVNANRKAPATQETKQLQPTMVPTPETEPSEQPYANSVQTTDKEEIGQNELKKDGSVFSIFGINPFETWLNIQRLVNEYANIPVYLDALVTTGEFITNPTGIKFPEPKNFLDPGGKSYNFLPGFIPHESIKPGLTISATKPTTFQAGSALIQLRPNNNQEGSMEMGTHPFLHSGEAEIIVEPQNGQQFELQTPNAEIFVIGTKFLVAYNPNKNQTLVAVYEGKVEVKTKDGKTNVVSPNSDKPGIVVVSQKLSVTKLLIVAAVAMTMVFALFWFFKKRGFARKKRSRFFI